jgi:membrane-associated phospholipid phosphatase
MERKRKGRIEKRVLILALIAALAAFVRFYLFAFLSHESSSDFELAKFFSGFGKGGFIDALTWFVSGRIFLVVLFVALIFSIVVLDKKRGKKILLAVLIAFVLYLFVGEVLVRGALTDFTGVRERPYNAFPDEIVSIGSVSGSSSFPSGHMMATVSILVVLIYFYRKKIWVWALALLFGLFMAFARMHNGAHYSSDVAGGAALGAAFALIAIYFVVYGKKSKFLENSVKRDLKK